MLVSFGAEPWARVIGEGLDRTSGNGFGAMERLTPAVLDSPTSRKGREKWGTLPSPLFGPSPTLFAKGAKGWGTLDLVLLGGWPVLSLVMLSSLRVSYPFVFGAEGWVRTGVAQAAGGWIFSFGLVRR
jgi:hypothetical protein